VGLAVEKGPDAFRTISEVAQDLDLPQHVLRFWETRFAQIKPLKRGGGRRYYRPDDIDLLRGIRHLLYGQGYTIRGVQQILREQGVRHVQGVGRSAEIEAPKPASSRSASDERLQPREVGMALIDLLPSLRSARPAPEMPRVVEVPMPPRPAPVLPVTPAGGGEDDMPPFPFRRRQAAGPAIEAPLRPPLRAMAEDDMIGPARTIPRGLPDNSKLSPEAVRLLKTTLFELGECRRLLEAGRADPA
jgi:DNA-binding transcriptional MerR regulator